MVFATRCTTQRYANQEKYKLNRELTHIPFRHRFVPIEKWRITTFHTLTHKGTSLCEIRRQTLKITLYPSVPLETRSFRMSYQNQINHDRARDCSRRAIISAWPFFVAQSTARRLYPTRRLERRKRSTSIWPLPAAQSAAACVHPSARLWCNHLTTSCDKVDRV